MPFKDFGKLLLATLADGEACQTQGFFQTVITPSPSHCGKQHSNTPKSSLRSPSSPTDVSPPIPTPISALLSFPPAHRHPPPTTDQPEMTNNYSYKGHVQPPKIRIRHEARPERKKHQLRLQETLPLTNPHNICQGNPPMAPTPTPARHV